MAEAGLSFIRHVPTLILVPRKGLHQAMELLGVVHPYSVPATDELSLAHFNPPWSISETP